MAAASVYRSTTLALTGTGTEDTVTLKGGYKFVHIINHSVTTAEKVNFSVDGTSTNTTPPDETEIALPSNPQGIYAQFLGNVVGPPVVKLRPVSGTPTVTVRGTNYVN